MIKQKNVMELQNSVPGGDIDAQCHIRDGLLLWGATCGGDSGDVTFPY